MAQNPLVILGGGYTGKALYKRATAEGYQVWCTSRQPDLHLTGIASQHRLHFDLNHPETWKAFPSDTSIIWCFPACPLDLVKRFMATRTQNPARLVVLGSTSAYPAQGMMIQEPWKPNFALPRVQGEEYLRTTAGAIIIRLAGIYGPGRNILDWIRKGKIRNTPRLVNLVHVEDVVGISMKALAEAPAGSTYLASDGTPRAWSTICHYAKQKWGIPIPPETKAPDPGKRIDNHKILEELHYYFRFPDLYTALDHLETQQCDKDEPSFS